MVTVSVPSLLLFFYLDTKTALFLQTHMKCENFILIPLVPFFLRIPILKSLEFGIITYDTLINLIALLN